MELLAQGKGGLIAPGEKNDKMDFFKESVWGRLSALVRKQGFLEKVAEIGSKRALNRHFWENACLRGRHD